MAQEARPLSRSVSRIKRSKEWARSRSTSRRGALGANEMEDGEEAREGYSRNPWWLSMHLSAIVGTELLGDADERRPHGVDEQSGAASRMNCLGGNVSQAWLPETRPEIPAPQVLQLQPQRAAAGGCYPSTWVLTALAVPAAPLLHFRGPHRCLLLHLVSHHWIHHGSRPRSISVKPWLWIKPDLRASKQHQDTIALGSFRLSPPSAPRFSMPTAPPAILLSCKDQPFSTLNFSLCSFLSILPSAKGYCTSSPPAHHSAPGPRNGGFHPPCLICLRETGSQTLRDAAHHSPAAWNASRSPGLRRRGALIHPRPQS